MAAVAAACMAILAGVAMRLSIPTLLGRAAIIAVLAYAVFLLLGRAVSMAVLRSAAEHAVEAEESAGGAGEGSNGAEKAAPAGEAEGANEAA